jgi:hypothetical protein
MEMAMPKMAAVPMNSQGEKPKNLRDAGDSLEKSLTRVSQNLL